MVKNVTTDGGSEPPTVVRAAQKRLWGRDAHMMKNAKIFRLMTAVASLGSLVAVVGAGTKWGGG
jgi:hypothetical protein